VLIIGGSFAGLACARNLRNDFDVTLIDRKVLTLASAHTVLRVHLGSHASVRTNCCGAGAQDFFEYTPGVLRLLVHPERFPALTAPLAKLRGISFVHGAAEEVLPGKVSVRRHGAVDSETLPFDFLVLGCGSSYCMDGIKASYGDIDDVQRQLSWNQQAARVQAARSILVVGGGPVGVELAAEVHRAPRPLHTRTPSTLWTSIGAYWSWVWPLSDQGRTSWYPRHHRGQLPTSLLPRARLAKRAVS
jgi:NADH dehydrogenase FAD-containing subunit